MGMDTGVSECNGVEKLSPRGREIVRLRLSGMKIGEIADKLGIKSRATIHNALRTRAARRMLEDVENLQDTYAMRNQKRVCDLTEKSLDFCLSVLNGCDKNGNEVRASTSQKLSVAFEHLREYSGLRVPTKIQNNSSISMTIEDLDRFKTIYRNNANSCVIDVPATEVGD